MHLPATMQPDCKFAHVQCVQMKFNNTEHETTGAFTAVAVAMGLAIREDWATLEICARSCLAVQGLMNSNSKVVDPVNFMLVARYLLEGSLAISILHDLLNDVTAI